MARVRLREESRKEEDTRDKDETEVTADEDEEERQEREAAADEAMNCPCLDDLKKGPCGQEFQSAFHCFLKSGHPEKGTDCVNPYFTALRDCINKNEEALLLLAPADDPSRYNDAVLPEIDPRSIRLPSFFPRGWKEGDPEPDYGQHVDEDGDTMMADD